ncbi:MFS transporter [Dehalobacter sp. DCM]|uniref:MFS transporter n=1 Tax=Dehalobacter sp. DCM TaxID=2907827 RepID=UPI0030816C59|nr:MFS transporter [Dehalobacter sp. DCM]
MESIAQQKNNGEILIRVLALILVFSVMNATIFNIVLPVISLEYHLSPSQVSWILTSYMIVYAVGSVIYGKLADQYRLKDLLTFGLLFFAIGSIVGFLANQFWMIILARVLQAVGASVIPATAMIIPVRYFAPERRGKALGTSAMGLALGSAIGPIVAGLVTTFLNWHFLFFLSLLPLITLPLFRKYLDNERKQAGRIDFLGGGLLAGTVTLLLLAITMGKGLLFAAFVAVLSLFVFWIQRAKEPFIQPSLFQNRKYAIGLILVFLTNAFAFAMPFMTPLFLAKVNHLTPALIGLIMFPGALSSALMGRKGGQLADKKGNKLLVYTAASLIFFCYILLSSVVGVSPVFIVFILIFGNLGQTFMSIAMSNTVSQTLAREQVGIGMGLYAMLNFISGATSTSLIGKILDKNITEFHFNPLIESSAGYIYSNIFFVFAFLIVIVAFLYKKQFGTSRKTVD